MPTYDRVVRLVRFFGECTSFLFRVSANGPVGGGHLPRRGLLIQSRNLTNPTNPTGRILTLNDRRSRARDSIFLGLYGLPSVRECLNIGLRYTGKGALGSLTRLGVLRSPCNHKHRGRDLFLDYAWSLRDIPPRQHAASPPLTE